MWKIVQIVIIGICIHFLLLVGIPETYLRSPIEHGMTPVKSLKTPVAKRVVIIIMDGLTLHCFENDLENPAPFLKSIRNTRAAWGVSYSRMPTQSRPCHLAILGGFHEESSPAYKNWRKFPVDFDTVLNQSKNAWVIGPYGTAITFRSKAPHVSLQELDSKALIYKTKNNTSVDQWVFQKLENLLNDTNKTIQLRLHEEGNIFSLLLTGGDYQGHESKPHSRLYLNAIKFVDDIVRKIEMLINETFSDNMTTFIFTADHGLTDWGGHGSGSNAEILTPFIIWGAGVQINQTRQDTDQINIAPLISVLLASNYPVNSLGIVPTNYLKLSIMERRYVHITNLRELFNNLNVKQQFIKNNWPFSTNLFFSLQEFEVTITQMEMIRNYSKFLEEFNHTAFKILDGIEYYNSFFFYPIISCFVLGLMFWMLYLLSFIMPTSTTLNPVSKKKFTLSLLFTLCILLLLIPYLLLHIPFVNYLYVIFPVSTCFLFLSEIHAFHINSYSVEKFLAIFYQIGYFALFLAIAIYSIHDQFYLCFIMMCAIYCMSIKPKIFQKHIFWYWLILCLILSYFLLLPTMQTKYNFKNFFIGFIMWQAFVSLTLFRGIYQFSEKIVLTTAQKYVFSVQIICFNASFLIMKMFRNEHLFLSWSSVLIPIFCIPFSMRDSCVRFLTILMAFAPFYLMTTMSYEMIFLTLYCMGLMLWIFIESQKDLDKDDIYGNKRKTVIFMAFVLIGYFGPGNESEISSFDPSWVGRLLSYFSEEKMIALILLRQTLPILFASCALQHVLLSMGTVTRVRKCFCTILLLFYVMVSYFTFNMRKRGGYYREARRLSHFIVIHYFTIAVLFYYLVASLLIRVHLDYFSWYTYNIL